MKILDATPTYQELLHRMVERLSMQAPRGLAIAITSINRGEGVSYVTNALNLALEEMLVPKILHVNLDFLESIQQPSEVYAEVHSIADTENQLARQNHSGIKTVSSMWNQSLQSRQNLIKYLCEHSNIVLIDCPPLRQDANTLRAAAVVDGVILVIQAGTTTKADISFAERKIIAAGGILEGYVLNKVKTVMPKWFNF